MQLTEQQAHEMKREIRRTFYASSLLRAQGDVTGHLRLVSQYCRTMTDQFGVIPIMAMSFLAGAGMDAVVDILGEEATEDLRNALYELEMDGE